MLPDASAFPPSFQGYSQWGEVNDQAGSSTDANSDPTFGAGVGVDSSKPDEAVDAASDPMDTESDDDSKSVKSQSSTEDLMEIDSWPGEEGTCILNDQAIPAWVILDGFLYRLPDALEKRGKKKEWQDAAGELTELYKAAGISKAEGKAVFYQNGIQVGTHLYQPKDSTSWDKYSTNYEKFIARFRSTVKATATEQPKKLEDRKFTLPNPPTPQPSEPQSSTNPDPTEPNEKKPDEDTLLETIPANPPKGPIRKTPNTPVGMFLPVSPLYDEDKLSQKDREKSEKEWNERKKLTIRETTVVGKLLSKLHQRAHDSAQKHSSTRAEPIAAASSLPAMLPQPASLGAPQPSSSEPIDSQTDLEDLGFNLETTAPDTTTPASSAPPEIPKEQDNQSGDLPQQTHSATIQSLDAIVASLGPTHQPNSQPPNDFDTILRDLALLNGK